MSCLIIISSLTLNNYLIYFINFIMDGTFYSDLNNIYKDLEIEVDGNDAINFPEYEKIFTESLIKMKIEIFCLYYDFIINACHWL